MDNNDYDFIAVKVEGSDTPVYQLKKRQKPETKPNHTIGTIGAVLALLVISCVLLGAILMQNSHSPTNHETPSSPQF